MEYKDELIVNLSNGFLEAREVAFVRPVRQFFFYQEDNWHLFKESDMKEIFSNDVGRIYRELLDDGNPEKVRIALELLEDSFYNSFIAMLKARVSVGATVFDGGYDVGVKTAEEVFEERAQARARRREREAERRAEQEQEQEVFEEYTEEG